METYDVVVLGAGPTGENVADYAVRDGLTAALVEGELVGGECSYWACMPSKALLRPAQALSAARRLPGAAAAVRGELDPAAVLARRDEFTHGWDDTSQADWATGAGIELVRGFGRLVAERRVAVGDRELQARHAVVIATGTSAAIPPVPGLAEARPWTSREATSAKAVPRRLAVLGGGVVGCEMATAWRALGAAEVTVLQRGDRLLPGVEPEASRRLTAAMRATGIDVRTGVDVAAVHRDADGVTMDLGAGGSLVADEVLVATGRSPRTRDLGLDTVGLHDGDWLAVDETLRVTGVDGGWLYACGDVNRRALLTHMGKYQARACAAAIVARAAGQPVDESAWSPMVATADTRAVPQVVFTDPEVTAVGLTEAQAAEAGIRTRCVEYELGSIAGASLFVDDYDGWAKLVIDEDRRVVVGATFVGAGVAELIHSATVAIVGEVPLDRLWHAVPSYPTISEIWLRLLETYRG